MASPDRAHSRTFVVTGAVAIEMLRMVVDDEFAKGAMTFRGNAVAALVETLLRRSGDSDVREAVAAIELLERVCRQNRGLSFTKSICCDFGRCSRKPLAIRPPISRSVVAIARW
jgi:hypothetical protein